jgi:5,10-methylenetetrahydrofolate reductase
MRTLQIENHEIESFIEKHYGQDTQSLWQDFATFVKVSLNDNYPGISASQAKRRVKNALKEIDGGTATMLTQEAYDKEMNAFMDKL